MWGAISPVGNRAKLACAALSLFSESSGSIPKVDQIPLRNLALQSALKEMGNDVRKSATRCTSLDWSTPSHNHFFIHHRI